MPHWRRSNRDDEDDHSGVTMHYNEFKVTSSPNKWNFVIIQMVQINLLVDISGGHIGH
jgi:hypothetical protein